jgi:uncharacterized protein DUF222/HNH endonuclease
MSTLRSALDELRATDVALASDEDLADDLLELERASRVIEAERSRRLIEVERRGAWSLDGHLSLVSWLAARLRLGSGRAARHVRLARALEAMPATREALASGEAAELLLTAREAAPETFREAESMLVEAATTLSPGDVRRAIAYWREAADSEQARERARRVHERRRLHVSPLLDGMVRIDGDLDPESGQTVITALRAVQDAWAKDRGPGIEKSDSDGECRDGGGDEGILARDGRTAPQRRADALTELCRAWLDRSDRPSVAGERPHVVVMVELESLAGGLGRTCELEEAGPIAPETARRIACDAGITRVIVGPASQPLDVGRTTPVVPASIRKALVVRDRGCRFPGCGRPPGWCDAHHVRHWADGGPTALGNLLLLCRRHHRAVHQDFRVRMDDGRPRFGRADGTPVEDRAPP